MRTKLAASAAELEVVQRCAVRREVCDRMVSSQLARCPLAKCKQSARAHLIVNLDHTITRNIMMAYTNIYRVTISNLELRFCSDIAVYKVTEQSLVIFNNLRQIYSSNRLHYEIRSKWSRRTFTCRHARAAHSAHSPKDLLCASLLDLVCGVFVYI